MEKVKGIVSKGKNQPIQLTEVVLPGLGKHDVKVKIVSCGVCHTDLAYVEGGINDDYPFLLGHEAAGIVEKIGSDVVHVQVGDTVILNWRAVCGECRSCKKGKPEYCFNTLNAENKMTLSDGTVLTPALGIGAFIEKTVVNEKQCTKIAEDVDLNAAGLLGCGVMAGIGAVINTGKVSRGDKVAVFGLGGVGMAAVAAANLAGATQIIAVDNKPEKLELAKKFGATNLLNVNAFPEITHIDSSVQNSALVKKMHEISGGFGVDVAVDAVGIPLTFLEAFYARDLAGTVVLVGVPTPTMKLNIDLLDVFSHGGNIKSSWYGDCLPERDFPMLIDLYNQGKFPLGYFVTEVTSLDQVEEAFTKMKQGKVLRSVVRP